MSVEIQQAVTMDEQAENNLDQGNRYIFDEEANIITEPAA